MGQIGNCYFSWVRIFSFPLSGGLAGGEKETRKPRYNPLVVGDENGIMIYIIDLHHTLN